MAAFLEPLLGAEALDFGVFAVDAEGCVREVSASASRLLGERVEVGARWTAPPEAHPRGGSRLTEAGRSLRLLPLEGEAGTAASWVVEDETAWVSLEAERDRAEVRVGLLRQFDAFVSFVEDALRTLEAAKTLPEADARARLERIEAAAGAYGLVDVARAAGRARENERIDEASLDGVAESVWSFLDEHAAALALDPLRFELGAGGAGDPADVWTERARLRPVRNLLGPVEAVVSRIAELYGREVELRVEGEEIAVDPGLMQPVLRGLGALLENAVVHGVEPPAERGEKSSLGEVVLSFSEREDTWTTTVEDDGRGFDVEGLAARVVERGLLSAEDVARMQPSERVAFAFLDGVGTGTGEAPGLAAVKDALDDVCGHLEVRTWPGRGTTVRIEVPKPMSARVRGSTGDLVGDLLGRAVAF